jgi:hypothetical protein
MFYSSIFVEIEWSARRTLDQFHHSFAASGWTSTRSFLRSIILDSCRHAGALPGRSEKALEWIAWFSLAGCSNASDASGAVTSGAVASTTTRSRWYVDNTSVHVDKHCVVVCCFRRFQRDANKFGLTINYVLYPLVINIFLLSCETSIRHFYRRR